MIPIKTLEEFIKVQTEKQENTTKKTAENINNLETSDNKPGPELLDFCFKILRKHYDANDINNNNHHNNNYYNNTVPNENKPPICNEIPKNNKTVYKTDQGMKFNRSPRTSFTRHQKWVLTEIFNSKAYLLKEEIILVAEALNVTEYQVKVWFQNYRSKCKRMGIDTSSKSKTGFKILNRIKDKTFKMSDYSKQVFFPNFRV